MLKKLYQKLRDLSASPKADPALAAVSFAEASFFPIPVDVMILPMATMRPKSWVRTAIIATIFSVLGGLFGYAIGMFLMDSIGKPLMDFYGYGEKLDDFQKKYQEYGALIIFLKGLTPIPFKLVTIASGMAHYNIWMFILASVITRGLRFALVAWAGARFGPSIEPFIEKQLYWVTGAFAVIIILGFWLVTKI